MPGWIKPCCTADIDRADRPDQLGRRPGDVSRPPQPTALRCPHRARRRHRTHHRGCRLPAPPQAPARRLSASCLPLSRCLPRQPATARPRKVEDYPAFAKQVGTSIRSADDLRRGMSCGTNQRLRGAPEETLGEEWRALYLGAGDHRERWHGERLGRCRRCRGVRFAGGKGGHPEVSSTASRGSVIATSTSRGPS